MSRPGTDRVGTTSASPRPVSLAGVKAATAAAATVRYTSETTRTKPGEAPTVEARVAGAVDLGTRTGRAKLDLVSLKEIEQQAGGEPSGIADLELSWTATTLTGMTPDGKKQTSPREIGSASLIERVPDEVAALVGVLGTAVGATGAGTERIDGVATRRVTATLPAAKAVDAGVGLEASAALREGPPFVLVVWLDEEDRPIRVRLTAVLPPTGPLPERTLITTYDFRDWGKPL